MTEKSENTRALSLQAREKNKDRTMQDEQHQPDHASAAAMLSDLIESNTAVAGVVGLGYVGLPLAIELARSGFRTIGFDVAEHVTASVNAGESHILDVPSDILRAFTGEGLLSATMYVEA